MLRKVVGDDAFFASLKNYLETNKYKTAEIHNLRLAFEETTGQDLNWFFNQWFLNKGRPKLKLTKTIIPNTNKIELTIEQTQNFKKYPLYKIPVDIDVYSGGKVERNKIVITEALQTFTLNLQGNLSLLNFDAERQLLCDLDYSKTAEEYMFQFRNAPLFEDRYESLKQLESQLSNSEVYNLFKDASLDDKYHVIRSYAMGKLPDAPADKLTEVKNTLLTIYMSDKKTKNRAKALKLLNKKFGTDSNIADINITALNEQSYAIVGEAIEALTKSNPKLAMEKVKIFTNESGKDVLYPIGELYANNGSDEQILFFRNALKYFNGFEVMGFISLYAKTAKRCSTNVAVLMAVNDLNTLGKGGSKFTKFSASKGIKDILSVWDTKEKALKNQLESAKKEGKDVASIEKEISTVSETKDIITKKLNEIK
jgi:aminopeptidase N